MPWIGDVINDKMTSFSAITATAPIRVVIVLFPRTKLLDVTGSPII
jgi:hypothetical protein